MVSELRKTGISIVGDVPFGTHLCHFYETKQDLLDTLIPYFKAGLESKEFCVWVVSTPELISVEEAKGALAQAVPDFDRHLSEKNIEILNGHDWYLEENVFNLERVTNAWDARLKRALALGYDGMRVSGDTVWLEEKDSKDFFAYEKQLNESITDHPMTALCTYPLAKSGAAEVLDVVQAHQFAIARRQGEWEVIETPKLAQAKAEIRRLNEDLEQRVVERTSELKLKNEELRKEMIERKQAEEALDERLRFETLVTELSAAFASLSPNEVDREIDKWLQTLVEFLGVDRASFFQFRGDWTTLYLGHSYTVPGIEPLSLSSIGINEQFPWITDQLRRGNTIKWSRIPDDLPEQAAKEKKHAATSGAKSVLNIPVLVGGSVICTISFTSIRIYCDWPDATVARLRLVGEIFAAAVERQRADAERKRADEALRESEARNRAILKALPDLIFVLTNDGFFLDYYAKDTGDLLVPPEQFLGKHVKDVLPPEVADSLTRGFQELTEASETRVLEYPLQVGEDHRHFEARVVRCNRDEILCVARNITERKQAEDALLRSEDHLRLVLDTTPALIHTERHDGYLDYINQGGLNYVGLSLEDLEGWGWTASIHPDDVEGIVNARRGSLASGEPFHYEARVRRGDGEYRWMLHHKVPLRDEHGNIIKWHGSSIDIEDRKQAEEALDERLRFETLVTELSAAFGNLAPNEVDPEIDKWLQTLVEFLGVDRASFFQFEQDWSTVYRSHSYTVSGIEPLPPPPIDFKDQFPFLTDQLRRGITVKWSRIPDELTEEAVKEKEYATSLGVKSGLSIPVPVGGVVICAVIFASITSYRDWPDAMIARLRLVGEIFAGAVERKRAEEALRQAEQKYREIFENAGEGIFQSTPDGRYIAANPALARMYGFASPEELIHSCQDISRQVYVDPARREEFKRRLEEQGVVRGFELEGFRKDGGTLWISVNARAVKDEQGAIQYYEGTGQDITARKIAEHGLRESEERYRELFENAKDTTYVHDLDGRYTSVNRAAEKLSGYTRTEILGRSFTNFVAPEEIENIRKHLCRKLVDEGETSYETEVITKDGRRVAVEVSSHVILENGIPVGVQGTARDIAERKAGEEKLKSTSDQLRALSARLQSAREEEGARIAREIHDELGSALTSLKWDLEEMDKILANSPGKSSIAALHEKLQAPIKLADTAISAIRRIASELRPSILDDLGLVAAIEWQAQQFQARTGIVCDCDCSVERIELSEELSTAVFRILQEALTNVLRHAQATRVDIKIKIEKGYLVLSIRDNGKGITVSENSEQRSLGILGMRERAHLIGGEIDIKGIQGKGTVVTVRVPISGQDRTLRMTR